MDDSLKIAPLPLEQIEPAMDLVWRVFTQFEAPDYSPEGVESFRRFIQPDNLRPRLESGEMWGWRCLEEEEIVGVLVVRERGSHISMLFVDPRYHRRGIARRLVETAWESHKSREGEALTVNSSPYALEAYRRMGFTPTDREQLADGIRFIPMVRR